MFKSTYLSLFVFILSAIAATSYSKEYTRNLEDLTLDDLNQELDAAQKKIDFAKEALNDDDLSYAFDAKNEKKALVTWTQIEFSLHELIAVRKEKYKQLLQAQEEYAKIYQVKKENQQLNHLRKFFSDPNN